ncbi:DUF3868 domain-containing protein [Alistipes sp.]|uniref:DUF3868 domain-containing protein n=1 Tax=Alistipes sp. TaxID=1872444 RepID=UPI0025B8035F|nr:DUF3868 domain-containing protein [Alistipes sp.]
MMNRVVRLAVLLTLLPFGGSVVAQKHVRQKAEVKVEDLSVVKSGNSLEIGFNLQVEGPKLHTNRSMKFTPVLVNGDSMMTFPAVRLASRRQYITGKRRGQEGILLNARKLESAVPYEAATTFRPWMEGAQLSLAQDFCGCGDDILAQERKPLKKLMFEIPVYELHPLLVFVKPRAEAVKHREESGSAYLDFPVNEVIIRPEYRGNAHELEKIMGTIDLVKNDTCTRITHINIHGFASPEGSFSRNKVLAQGRAEALKNYVLEQYGFSEDLFTVQSTPEDWAGLRRHVAASSLVRRVEILGIIDSEHPEDEKSRLLEELDGRKSYLFLLKNVYPSLRHSDYTVQYVVRPFSVEEGKRILKTRPQLLSLNEMYLIAQTYEPGSEEFKEVFDIAVRLYPDDRTANLNAANIALAEGALERAARHLAKAGTSPEAVHAEGVYHLLKGDCAKAEGLLLRAEREGVRQAAGNLEMLEKKRENIRLIEESLN